MRLPPTKKTCYVLPDFFVLHVAYKRSIRDIFSSVVWHVLLLGGLDCVVWVFDASYETVGLASKFIYR